MEKFIKRTQLVPIRVGMIPAYVGRFTTDSACPHTRGDDPHDDAPDSVASQLVPIRVGMIPLKGHHS